MKAGSLLFAALLSCGVVSGASAMTVAPQKAQGLDVQQAHSVRVCERGRCYWQRDHHHWGYGGGWRKERGWRDRDHWDRGRDRYRYRDWDRDHDWDR